VTTTVAILGTGKMGGAMARRLAASDLDVILWNRTPDKAQALRLGRVAATPAEAVRDAQVVISSLTNDAAIREVYLGEHGAFHDTAGKLFIEMSTAGPAVIEELDGEAQTRGARLLEAPVVGSVPAVESGKLLILVAGDREDLAQALPLLEHLGEVLFVGERGNAQRLKLIANSMLGITTAAAAELLAAGVTAGLEPRQVFSILTRFAPGLGARERGFLEDEHTPTMFAVRDLVKDLDLALRTYAGTADAMPLTRAARDEYAATMADASDLDISAIAGSSGPTARVTP
jgi:3-hydroxyisobutyrate dehydrogenase-like beta-hydroxyacid dehydrogenase